MYIDIQPCLRELSQSGLTASQLPLRTFPKASLLEGGGSPQG